MTGDDGAVPFDVGSMVGAAVKKKNESNFECTHLSNSRFTERLRFSFLRKRVCS